MLVTATQTNKQTITSKQQAHETQIHTANQTLNTRLLTQKKATKAHAIINMIT